jgi:hypothetical protein
VKERGRGIHHKEHTGHREETARKRQAENKEG